MRPNYKNKQKKTASVLGNYLFSSSITFNSWNNNLEILSYCAGLKVAATVLIELCVSSSCLSSSVITRGFGKFSIGFSCS